MTVHKTCNARQAGVIAGTASNACTPRDVAKFPSVGMDTKISPVLIVPGPHRSPVLIGMNRDGFYSPAPEHQDAELGVGQVI